MKRYKLIRLAEYAAVSASVLGTIAAISTQQPAYAVAPLSVSAALNLLSRQQQEQRLEQQHHQTITQINQRLDRISQQNKILQHKLDALDQTNFQDSIETANTDIEALSTNLQTLETSLQQQIQETLAQFNEQVEATKTSQLETTATNLQALETSLQQQIQSASEDIQTIQQRLAQQDEQMSTFANTSRLETFANSLQQLQTSLDALAAQTEAQIPQQIQQITQTSSEQHTGLANRANRLETNLTELRYDITNLQQELLTLSEQIRAQPVSRPPEKIGPDFSQLIPQLPTDEDFSLEINLGIDFGTGYTKVCFRDLAQDYSEIVTFADAETGLSLDQTLIPTKLVILQDDTLLTGLTVAEWQADTSPIKQSVDFIKMRLANLDISESTWRLEQLAELDDPATVESLCAYYLSTVIGRAQRWIETNRPDLFANQTVRWSVNVGVPVEYCDSPALDRFRRVLSLAWLLNYTSIETTSLTITTLNQLVANLRQWMESNTDNDLDCNTTPEIAAAVWSFLSSHEAQEGFYTFFDIGDGTLDGAAFRFWREGGGDLRVDFYSGQVEPLGVTAFTQQAAAELNSSPEHIRQALTDTSNNGLNDQMQSSQMRRSVQQLVASVVIRGNEQHHNSRNIMVKDDIGRNLKVFVGGGGGNTTFFKDTIQSTHTDFKQENAGIPPYKITHIPPPKDLSVNGIDPKEFNRFAVAYGLCIPNWEGPEIRLPSQIETNESPFRQLQERPERYEDTKDMM